MTELADYTQYLFQKAPLTEVIVTFTAVTFVRYLATSGLAYFALYILWPQKFESRRIQEETVKAKTIFEEIYWSLITCAIFSAIGIFWILAFRAGLTKTYLDFESYGTGYFLFSLAVMIFVHDTYYYWIHRFLHIKPIFRRAHKAHHDSRNPTPWAALSFHPYEAILEGVILLIFVFFLPIHPRAFTFFMLAMTLFNVQSHLGFEFWPKSSIKIWPLKYVINATHHNLHHKYVSYNYGFYFKFWDNWCGTNHPSYEPKFEEVTSRELIGGTDTAREHNTTPALHNR